MDLIRMTWMGVWCLVAALLIHRLTAWLRRAALLRHLPTPKGKWILGHLEALARPDHHATLTRWAAELGGIYRIRLAYVQAVIVTDPYLVAELLSRTQEVEKSVDLVYSHFNILLHAQAKPNIFTSKTDSYWKLVRKGIAPAFNPKNIRKGFKHVIMINEQLIRILEAKGAEAIVDLDNATQRVTLDVIGRVGFDKDFGATESLDGGSANVAFDLMGAGRDEGIKRWNNPFRKYMRFLPSVRTGDEAFAQFRQIMADLRDGIKAKGPVKDDDMSIAAHILRIRDIAGNPLPDDRLAAEMGVIFTGGFETTGHTIAWALFMISQHPEVERKVLEELDRLEPLATPQRRRPRPMTYDDLAALTYTHTAIKESMRMLPVLSDGTNRMTERDISVGGHLLPKGTMVWIPFNGMFNSPHNWHNPGVYSPDRWEDPEAEYALPQGHQSAPAVATNSSEARPKRFMPFSNGSRDCVGQNLARMNYTTTVAMLLSRFSFRLADELGGYEGVRAVESSGLMTLQPLAGLKVHAIQRVLSTKQTADM